MNDTPTPPLDPAAVVQAALRRAAEQFRMYEQSHAAKGSLDGDAKARTNCEMAEMCEAALAHTPSREAPEVVGEMRLLGYHNMGSGGRCDWTHLREAVSEANTGRRSGAPPFDPKFYPGHHTVEGINYNSLDRIVTAFVDAALAVNMLATPSDGLFEAIQHGDEEHRAWLKEAIADHFAGRPVKPARGSGRKEARIAELEAMLATPSREGVIERAERWLRECSVWLLTNDLDMQCPMEADPLDIADDLLALRNAQPAASDGGAG